MTFAWGAGNPDRVTQVEFTVNKQNPPRTVSIQANVMKKKNLQKGDLVDIRLLPNGKLHTFTHLASTLLPAPVVNLELADDYSTGVAVVTFAPVTNATHYQVDMMPLDFGDMDDNETGGWVVVSDCLKNPGVKKKNLFVAAQYSFRYRAAVGGGVWTEFSAASLPQRFPAPRAKNPVLSQKIAPQVLTPQGTLVDTVARLSGKVIALYFSASWCGPCRQFSPRLVEFHKQMRAMGKEFEVVFVSLDRDAKSFQEYYYQHMPAFLAIPFEQSKVREQLQNTHQVEGIPSLKILSYNTGQCVEPNGTGYPLELRTFESWQSKM